MHLKELALKLRRADRLPGGLGDDQPDTNFDPAQLEKGVAVEMEHTSDPDLAREITKDHLTEDPTYYDKLKQIEGSAMSLSQRLRRAELTNKQMQNIRNAISHAAQQYTDLSIDFSESVDKIVDDLDERLGLITGPVDSKIRAKLSSELTKFYVHVQQTGNNLLDDFGGDVWKAKGGK